MTYLSVFSVEDVVTYFLIQQNMPFIWGYSNICIRLSVCLRLSLNGLTAVAVMSVLSVTLLLFPSRLFVIKAFNQKLHHCHFSPAQKPLKTRHSNNLNHCHSNKRKLPV